MTGPAATILIVDDEIESRRLLEALLRPEGYLTLNAANGEEALTSIAERAPDLILLDIMMPGMDGYEVAARLKANPATSNIPIIMVTAQLDRSAHLAGLNAGAEEFLTKPVDRAELWLRVRNLLRLKAYGDFLQNHSVILEQQVQARMADLRAGDERFRQMAENIRDVFFLRDADSNRMLYVSPAYEEIWGRSCESLYAKPESWLEAIHPDDRASANENYKQSKSKREFEYKYRIVRPDGSIRWIETRGFPVCDDAGKVVRITGVVEDITERKRAEEEIRGLAKFPAENPYPVLRIERNGTILYANQSSAPILTTWGREVGQNVPDDWQKWIAVSFESGITKEVEIECNRRIFSCILAPILAEEYVNVYGRDITERKRAEGALQQEHASLLSSQQELFDAHESLAVADRMESVGRLAAGVAHEVKNPLTIIRLGVDYLAKQFSQESNQAVLDKIRAAIDRADNVIGDLLGFSRQKAFAPRPTDIDEVIDNALHLIKHETDRRDIAIIRNRDDLMPPIFADPDRLVQVFINLLTNAAQAIGQGGNIEVVTRSICLSERDLGHAETSMFRAGEPMITVDIRDNGPGISAEHEKKLFDPFFTTKPVGEGSGLGLAVTRNIVILHRGSIRISNRPEGGASARLMFRVDREHLTNEKANTGSRR